MLVGQISDQILGNIPFLDILITGCTSATLPDLTVVQENLTINGKTVDYTLQKERSGLFSFTYYEDEPSVLTRVFEQWVEFMTPLENGIHLPQKYTYFPFDFILQRKSSSQNVIKNYTLSNVKIRSVSALPATNEAAPCTTTITVSFGNRSTM